MRLWTDCELLVYGVLGTVGGLLRGLWVGCVWAVNLLCIVARESLGPNGLRVIHSDGFVV